MAQKTRGVIRIILNSIFSSARPKTKPKLIGEDYFGTKYFEEPPESSGRKTRGRYFVPVNQDEFQQELPAEWESWLRYRRAEPPTKEEIEINYQMILTKRESAAKLEQKYAVKRDTTTPKLPDKQHAAANFPVYEEYEESGRNDDPNK